MAQTHQSPQTPKAINDPEPTRFLGHGDDHDRHLLTTSRQGSQQSLLSFLGRWWSIILVGVAFGLAHGLVEALLVLVPFGIALAWLRDRTDSVVPGMFVHGLFNAAALIAIVLS